eukprot:4024367-Alexandrium_andersonii.AAC.1
MRASAVAQVAAHADGGGGGREQFVAATEQSVTEAGGAAAAIAALTVPSPSDLSKVSKQMLGVIPPA